MQPTILQVNTLVVDQAVASSLVPIVIGSTGTGNTPFSYPTLPALKKIYWELTGLFTLGATGGFRFLANAGAGVTAYNAQWTVEENTTPATLRSNQTAEAAFANASAVAATYALKAYGSVINGAAQQGFTLEFAQNTSDLLPITLKAGLFMKLFIL